MLNSRYKYNMADEIRILYVDDEPALLENGKIFLERSGQFSVDTITSAPAALTLLNTKNYDAIIADYQMPDMDGIEFLKTIRSSGKSIPFILFTGRGREEVVILALNEGADFYLQKGGEPTSQFAELSNKIRYAVMHRKAEVALRESEERYRRIVETTDEGISQMDDTFETVYVNRRMAEMLDYTPEEMIGRNIASFMAAEDIPDNTARIKERRQGKSSRYERRFITKNGRTRWMQVSATPLMDPDGRFRGSFLMCSDITDRKTAEEEIARHHQELYAAYKQLKAREEEIRQNYDELAKSQNLLRESEQRYRNVVEDQTEFICRFLPDGTHVFVNDAYCRYFGLKREEIIGQRFTPTIPVENQERMKRFFASLTLDHPIATIEHRIVKPDGTIRWQRWSDRAIFDPSGTITEYQSVGRDTTGRKVEEQALHENEQRLDSIYNTVGDVIFQLTVEPDGQYRFASVNAAFGRVTGLPPGQVIGRKVNEIIPEPSLSLVREKYRQAIVEKAIVRWEETTDYPTGQLIGEVSIAPIFDKAGNCTHLIGSVHDITERKSAEEALRESETISKSLLNSIPDGALLMDPQGTILAANQVIALRWMMSVNELRGKNVYSFLPAVVGERRRELVREAVETGSLIHFIDEREGRTYSNYLNPISGEDGKVYSISAVSRDITDEKKAEEALRESEERFRNIFSHAAEGILIADISTQKFLYANSAICSMLGYSAEELTSKEMRDIHPEKDLAHVQEEFMAQARGEKTLAESIPVLRKDGAVRYMDIRTTPVMIDKHSCNLGMFTDITGRRHAEEVLRKANKKLSLLSGITRHDINNQMTVLRSYLAILEKGRHDPSQEEYIRKAEAAAERISAIIRFTKQYEAIGVSAPVWQDCSALVRNMVKQAPPGKLVVKNEIPAGIEVFADPLITAVFYNLMDNAVRHGGKITTLRFSVGERDGAPILVCEDDGVGVPAGDKERIFDRGFGKNTGLGLALAREILDITGITIRETGEPGKGARFEMLVPKGAFRLPEAKERKR
jgi:PAS domain S-box-containing protein